jgi:hypothetical protein
MGIQALHKRIVLLLNDTFFSTPGIKDLISAITEEMHPEK